MDQNKHTWWLAGGAVGLAVLFFGWQYLSVRAELGETAAQLATTTASFQTKIVELEGQLALAEREKTELAESLDKERGEKEALAEQVGEIAESVGELEKLNELDPELLQKYSRVYFLNEHYVPKRLTDIAEEFLYQPAEEQQIHSQVLPRLERLLEAAHDDDIELKVASAYRSFGEQQALKSSYRVTYGSGANQFSADQGYSEHQLGTTVDFAVPTGTPLTAAFEQTAAYEWLTENAWRSGFVLSYPRGNSYYQFEPWHWRYVGRDLARKLHNDDKYFYDLDQRTIDEHLISIFD